MAKTGAAEWSSKKINRRLMARRAMPYATTPMIFLSVGFSLLVTVETASS
jgi:hypothetical protein